MVTLVYYGVSAGNITIMAHYMKRNENKFPLSIHTYIKDHKQTIIATIFVPF